MKKIILSTMLLASMAVLYTGCKKDDNSPVVVTPDTTDPVITLKGASPLFVVAVSENFETTDPGATATDDRDGDITSEIVTDYSAYMKDVAGEYLINYSVSDTSGNTDEVTRTIYVTHTGAQLSGVSFLALDTTTQGTSTVNLNYNSAATYSSLTANKFKVYLDNFSDGLFATGSKVELDMEANRITIPTQTPNGSGSSVTISGTGTMTYSVVTGVYTLHLNYTISGVSGGTITDHATFTSI